MTPGATASRESLAELNDEIRRLSGEAADEKERLHARIAQFKADGKSVLTDPALAAERDEIVAGFKAADEKAVAADKLRAAANAILPTGQTIEVKGGDGGSIMDRILKHPDYASRMETDRFESNGRVDLNIADVASRAELMRSLRAGRGFTQTPSGLWKPNQMGAILDLSTGVAPDFELYPPIPLPAAQPRVIDLVRQATTDSNAITYLKMTTRTDAAAATAYGTAYSAASYVWTQATANVYDIGQYAKAHRSQMADAGQLGAIIENLLEFGVNVQAEAYVINGNGTNQPTGILQTSGIGSVSRNGTTPELRLEAVHRGITNVRLNLFMEPDAIAVHPTDYQTMVFEKGTDGQYLLGPAFAMTSKTIWGFPAVITPNVPQGTAIVGLYKYGATLWLRSGLSTRMTDSDQDDFIKRQVTILAEIRAAFGVQVPKAFCKVTNL